MNRYPFNNNNYSWFVKSISEAFGTYRITLNICEYGNDPVRDDESVERHAYLDESELAECLTLGIGDFINMEALFQKDND